MSQKDDTSFSLDEDRGSAIASGRREKPNGKMIVAIVAVVVLVGLALYYGAGSSEPKENTGPKTTIRQSVPFEPAALPVPTPAALPIAPMPSPVTQEKAAEEDKMLASSRRAPLTGFNRSTSKGASGSPNAPPVGVAVPEEKNELEAKMTPTKIEGVRASMLGNRNFIIAQGTSIPCVLETAMSSDQPGFVTCVITRDVLSDNGRVVLLDRGTQVTGEYRGGLRRGQKRLFVLWTRAKTPKGVVVALASPGTDALGRAGFDGEIDTHWWERFGSSLVLSLVDDFATIATSRWIGNGDGNNNVTQNNFESTQDAGKDAAAIAVQESINIPPTLTKNQGELVNIMVARDLDFSNIYGLQVTEKRTKVYDRGVTGDFERFTGPARQ